MGWLELTLFVLLSAAAVIASLHAWRTRQAYGFFRFLAFESSILLIVWNADRWFRDPLSAHQLVSWILFVVSTLLAAHGFYLLRVTGRAQARLMEDTQILVEAGAYRFIRHPLYASLILFGWGVFFKGTDWPSAVLAVIATALWIPTARCEERLNVEHFGAPYSEYMKRTKMFFPFLL